MARRIKVTEWSDDKGINLIQGWTRDGATMEQIAERIGIGRTTLYEWAQKNPNIADALKKGREAVDKEVENALLKRALGYSYDETTKEKIGEGTQLTTTKIVHKQIPPDVGAIAFWLKNRMPDTWKDRKEQSIDLRGTEELQAAYEDVSKALRNKGE